MNNIIDEYLNFIQIEKGLSNNTIGAYRRDLKNIKIILQITRFHISILLIDKLSKSVLATL